VIINRAFYRETAGTTLAIAAVLLVVMVLMSMTLLLGRAVRGDQPGEVVYLLLGFQTLAKIDVLLPLALYLGVLLTLSRWYRDSEMTVLAACGIGLLHFLRPAMMLGLIFATVVSVGSFYFTPLAARQIDKVKNESTHRSDPNFSAPGVFLESISQGRIFYAEHIQDNGDVAGVFVSSLEAGKQGVMMAKYGHVFTDSKTGDKFFALHNGTVYEGEPGMPNYRILEFDVYNLRIEPKKLLDVPVTTSGLPSLLMFGRTADREINAELHWRLGKTLASFVLILFAMALAYTDLRRGRLSNLFVAILVYFIYSNLLGIGETMLQKGSVPPAAGLWWVHGVMALFALHLLIQRAHNQPLWSVPAIFRRQ